MFSDLLYVLNEEGQPVPADQETWASWMETHIDQRRVALDMVGPVRVSTVFLGVNRAYSPSDQPILWETCILGPRKTNVVGRYTSREEALEGHARQVAGILRSVK